MREHDNAATPPTNATALPSEDAASAPSAADAIAMRNRITKRTDRLGRRNAAAPGPTPGLQSHPSLSSPPPAEMALPLAQEVSDQSVLSNTMTIDGSVVNAFKRTAQPTSAATVSLGKEGGKREARAKGASVARLAVTTADAASPKYQYPAAAVAPYATPMAAKAALRTDGKMEGSAMEDRRAGSEECPDTAMEKMPRARMMPERAGERARIDGVRGE